MSVIAARLSFGLISRRRMIAISTIGMSVALTGVMSLLFNHTLRIDMMTTGFVCALVIHKFLARITGHYRRQLAVANQTLEHRVHQRTIELEDANTALHRAAALEASLRDELMVRDRMATAGMLAAGVSHEIRSPLQVILIAVDEVREALGPAAAPAVSTTINDIADAGARIALIVQDLSSFAKPVDDPLSAVNLGEVVASAARLASYKFGPGVTLAHDSIDVPPVVGNSGRLVQLVLNLLVNAARATRPDVANAMRVSAALEGDRVVLAIADTGTGMSPQTQARLFEAFFTTGGDRGGTGLGLMICKSIVEKMGGTIAITSELGVGTTVRVALQRA